MPAAMTRAILAMGELNGGLVIRQAAIKYGVPVICRNLVILPDDNFIHHDIGCLPIAFHLSGAARRIPSGTPTTAEGG
jgi:hypothetical protein